MNDIPPTPSNTIIMTQNLSFWKYETKMIIIGAVCFVISSGCITILLIERSNCALNNACFSVLGAIVGLLTGLNSSRTGKCSRSESIV